MGQKKFFRRKKLGGFLASSSTPSRSSIGTKKPRQSAMALWRCAFLLLAVSHADGFVRLECGLRKYPGMNIRMSEVTEVEAPTAIEIPAESQTAKSDLLSTVQGFGSMVSGSKRVLVNELLIALETANPTEAPARSPLLNGEWELMYTGGYGPGIIDWSPTRQLALFLYAGGYAPAAFGLKLAQFVPDNLIQVGAPIIAISREEPRVEARSQVQFGNSATDVKITSTLEAESDTRLKETNSAISLTTGSSTPRAFELPQQLQYSRLLFITYLDDDLLVVRDDTGVPEILFRKEKEFPLSEGEPSSADDDISPGAG